MKIQRVIVNGIIIFLGISAFFVVMELLGLSKNFYLRILNVLFVFYGVNKTIKENVAEGIDDYVTNLLSMGFTAMVGVVLSVLSLAGYIYYKGGDSYISNLSEKFLFGGASVNEYCAGLLFEGLASGMIVVFITLQIWRSKTIFK